MVRFTTLLKSVRNDAGSGVALPTRSAPVY